MERHLKSKHPKIIAIGTGRALRACVEQLPKMDCPSIRIVSLLGNMMSDGSATAYNVVIRMAERVNARHYPMPLPVHAGQAMSAVSCTARNPFTTSSNWRARPTSPLWASATWI
jgi:DNA-binding transcriptional regulator LsrR (DeoR family)